MVESRRDDDRRLVGTDESRAEVAPGSENGSQRTASDTEERVVAAARVTGTMRVMENMPRFLDRYPIGLRHPQHTAVGEPEVTENINIVRYVMPNPVVVVARACRAREREHSVA